jgi:urea carboxylase
VSGRLRLLQPGLQTTVQDYPGRIGYWRVGVPPSGPMDALSFRLANLLVGNPEGAAALEFQLTGPVIRFEGNAVVAITGGECGPLLNGRPVPQWQTVRVEAGGELRCAAVRRGARGYLAIAGGFERPLVLGSRATFPRGGIGGGPLQAGDTLAWNAQGLQPVPARVAPALIPDFPDDILVEVTPGPHLDWLDREGQHLLTGSAWTVSSRSDRTGIRLGGPRLSFSRRAIDKSPEHGGEPSNVINTGYPVGGVNLCGDTPIILPVDGPSQGGFITPLVVASAALWKVGQARPGQRLRFRLVSLDEAIELRRGLERRASALSLEAAGSAS